MTTPRLSVSSGQRIGRGIVIDPEVIRWSTKKNGARQRWRCARLVCDCGTEYVSTLPLLVGSRKPGQAVRSCGCLSREHQKRREFTSFKSIRAEWYDRAFADYLAAESACRGNLLNRRGQAAGIDPWSLWSWQDRRARAYASEELLAWWKDHPRITVTAYIHRYRDAERADRDEWLSASQTTPDPRPTLPQADSADRPSDVNDPLSTGRSCDVCGNPVPRPRRRFCTERCMVIGQREGIAIDGEGYRRVILGYAAAATRRIAAGHVDDLSVVVGIPAVIENLVGSAIRGLRDAGYSWADIGRELGITRQAAQQRWGDAR